MAIKRVIVESNLAERPFRAGETLFSYAKRVLLEDGLPGVIFDVSAKVSILDVSTHGKRDTVCAAETVEIEVWTEGIPR